MWKSDGGLNHMLEDFESRQVDVIDHIFVNELKSFNNLLWNSSKKNHSA